LNTALPTLEEFYRKAYDLNLSDMLFYPLARELSIVRRYIGVAKEDTALPRIGILITFRWQYFRDAIVGSGNLLYDPDGWLRDIDEWQYELNSVARTPAEQRGWDIIGEGADTRCIICGESRCIVAISEPNECEGEEVYYAEALHCPSCGLYIDRSHGMLAKLHDGPITRERIGPEAWENEIPR
jgi:hypothetical protein